MLIPRDFRRIRCGYLLLSICWGDSPVRVVDNYAQLYLNFPNVAGAPTRALRAFKRLHLKAGESQKVHFDLAERDLSMVSEAGEPIIAEGRYSVSIGGGQPNTGPSTIAGTFQVKGMKTLPE